MGDVGLLVKRLALGSNASQVERKALEYLRRSNAILGYNALGKAEICKAAVCVDLACMTLQVPLDSNAVAQSSGVAKTMYKNARATLQKALGIRQSFTARDLCISFGCARYETSIRTTLSTFKHRYLDSLQEQTLKNVDLSRPVFLAAAFFLVTKQNKVKVQKDRLLSQLGVTSSEFSMAIGSFLTFMPELEATNPSQKKTKDSSSGKERKRKKNLSTNKDNDTHQGNGGNDEEGDCGGDSDTENENGSRDCLSDQDENANDISSKKKKRLMTEETLRRIVLGESNSIR